MAKATIIVGSLDDQALRDSIDNLVNEINKKMGDAALSFEAGIQLMEGSLRSFANSAKSTVKDIKDTFTQLGTTFNDFAIAMQKAAAAAAGFSGGAGGRGGSGSAGGTGGSAGGTDTYGANTVGELRQQITEAERLLNDYEQFSPALQKAVDSLKAMRDSLKEMLTDSRKIEQAQWTKEIQAASTMSTATLDKAQAKLQRLVDIRNSLQGTGLFDEAKMNRLNRQIELTEKRVEKLKFASEDTSVSFAKALAMPERTLDNIAAKLKAIAQVRGNTDVESGRLHQLNEEYARLSKLQDRYLEKNLLMQNANNSLARTFEYIKRRIAYALSVVAIQNFTQKLYEIRGQYELLERSLGILVGSLSRGSEIFRELNAMAIQSPFTLIELSTAAKQLSAYNFAASEVVETTRRMADISAALGVPMERIVYNLGQIRAQTVLTARDARDFANAGLPILQKLADYYTNLEGRVVSTGDVFQRMSKKQVEYKDVMMVLNQLTDEGGRFFEFQAKQAETLKVQMANLTLAYNNMLNDLGERQKTALELPLQALRTLLEHWEQISDVITQVAIAFGSFKAAQLLTASMRVLPGVTDATTAALQRNIQAEARANVSRLNRISITRALTEAEQKELAQSKAVLASTKNMTAADYQRALGTANLTKQEAFALVVRQKNNVALQDAIVKSGLLTKEELANALATSRWKLAMQQAGVAIQNLKYQMVALMTSPTTWFFVVIGLLAEFISHSESVKEAYERLTSAVRDAAREASESTAKFLKDYDEIRKRIQETNDEFSNDEAVKAWQAIREEIEAVSATSDKLIATLLSEEDVVARVRKGFDMVESIQKSEEALSQLENQIKIHQDSFMWGLFGEGFASDMKDLNDAYDAYKVLEERYVNGKDLTSHEIIFLQGWEAKSNQDLKEAEQEIRDLAVEAAQNIHSALKYDVYDATQLAEAIARVKQQIKETTPELKGFAERFFDVEFDKDMAEVLKHLSAGYEAGESVMNDYFQILRHNYSSLFGALTEGLIANSGKWTTEQINALEQGLEELTQRYPMGIADETISQIRNQLNSQEFRVRAFVEFNGRVRDTLQADYEEHFYPMAHIVDLTAEDTRKKQQAIFSKYNKKDAENWEAWQKRMRANAKATKESIDELTKGLETLGERTEENATRWDEMSSSLERSKKEAEYIQEVMDYEGMTMPEKKQKKQRDLLLEALRSELSIIKEMRASYDKLRKAGVDSESAIDLAAKNYEVSINKINGIFDLYGVAKFDATKFAGTDLKELLGLLESQRRDLTKTGKAKIESLKDLDIEIHRLEVDAKVYDLHKISQGLNDQLAKLKEEYELAVELDANPVLGRALTDAFGISEEGLSVKDMDSYIAKLQEAVNTAIDSIGIKQNPFDILKDDTKKWADKVGQAYTQDVISDFVKSLEATQKQAQTEYKTYVANIVKETETLEYKLADVNDKITIEEKKLQRLRERLESTQNDRYKALLELRIKDEERTIAKLKEEALKAMPFYMALFDGVEDKSRKTTKKLIAEAQKIIKEANKKKKNGTYTLSQTIENGEEKKTTISVEKYQELIRKINKEAAKVETSWEKIRRLTDGSEVNAENWAVALEEASKELKKAGSLIGSITDLGEQLGLDDGLVNGLRAVQGVTDGISDGVEGVSKVMNGDFLGGATSLADGVTKIIKAIGDAYDNNITRKIEESERKVKSLEIAYASLEQTISKSYGTAVVGAQRATIANKEMQLSQLQYQLKLEESRKKKHRDEDKILDLRSQIQALQYDIANATEEIVNGLLGISSVGDAAEQVVSSMIEAFKNGEDYMKVFSDSFEEMVDNMIMKAIVSHVVGQRLEKIFQAVNDAAIKRADESLYEGEKIKLGRDGSVHFVETDTSRNQTTLAGEITRAEALIARAQENGYGEVTIKALEDYLAKLEAMYAELATPTPEDIAVIRGMRDELQGGIKDDFDAFMEAYGIKYGQGAEGAGLSALQQGIQGITEDTAGALEAYMNGVSQQVYLQSSLLTDILNTVAGFDFEVQNATFGQMLLQLQNSYQIQQSMLQTMNSWSTSSGSAVKVELIN